MDNKTCYPSDKSDSLRSASCCRARTCGHVIFLFFNIPVSSLNSLSLTDAHAHIVENGLMMELPLAGSKSVQGENFIVHSSKNFNRVCSITEYLDVVERVRAYVVSHPDVQNDMTRWIEGWGWDQTTWSIAQFPTAVGLDFIMAWMITSYVMLLPRPILIKTQC